MERFRSLLGRHLKDYRANAVKRGIEWRLTVEEFQAIVSLQCHYCGASPKRLKRRHTDNRGIGGVFRSKEKLNGIDRIDPAKPYQLSNCVAACKRCNQGKNNMSTRQFVSWIIRIVKHGGFI